MQGSYEHAVQSCRKPTIRFPPPGGFSISQLAIAKDWYVTNPVIKGSDDGLSHIGL